MAPSTLGKRPYPDLVQQQRNHKRVALSPRTSETSKKSSTYGPKSIQQQRGLMRDDESIESLDDSVDELQVKDLLITDVGSPDTNSDSSSDVSYWPPPCLGFCPPSQYGDEPAILEDEMIPDVDDNDGSTSSNDLPVRFLDDFTFYRDLDFQLCAVGHVSPKVEDCEDDDEVTNEESEVSVPLKLVAIEDCYHGYGDMKEGGYQVWIQTTYAWYILCCPASGYVETYKPFFLNHLFTQFILRLVLEDPSTTWNGLVQLLTTKDIAASDLLKEGKDVLDMELSLMDLQENCQLPLIQESLLSYEDPSVLQAPLISRILGNPIIPASDLPPTPSHLSKGSKTQTHIHNRVTPTIYQLANQHFLCPLRSLGPLSNIQQLDTTLSATLAQRLLRGFATAPGKVILGPRRQGGGGEGEYYPYITLDGVKYQPGDVVLLKVGDDESTERENSALGEGAKSPNQMANEFWFVEIIYFYKEKGNVFFHGRWFYHSSKTLLREASDAQELFLSHECDDHPVHIIVSKANVVFVDANSSPPNTGDPRDFFYRYLVLSKEGKILDAISYLTRKTVEYGACPSCEWQDEVERATIPRLLEDGSLSFQGEIYHCNDFVYIAPDPADGVYLLGQLYGMKVQSVGDEEEEEIIEVKVKPLKHSPEDVHSFSDERKLLFHGPRTQYSAYLLQGKFYAISDAGVTTKELDQWLRMPNHFFISSNSPFSPSTLSQCTPCLQARRHHIHKLQTLSKHRVLKAMDIFSGAGGFELGLDQTGYISTQWSIEYDHNAALTLRNNRQDGHVVIEDDVNNLIKALYDRDVKHLPQNGPKLLLPQATQVDLIYCGPPCQSFSRANSEKKVDDPRHSLSMTALSFVDIYQPDYFILENVVGMTVYPLVNSQHKEVKMGIVKVILRCLTAMGYQVHFNILQAGAYGAPQSRRRLIIMAAKRGCPLPDMPKPTHYFKESAWSCDTTDGFRIQPLPSSMAALRAVTVNDAISDLPVFDWKDPRKPRGRGFNHLFGVDQKLPYHLPKPANRYQKWVRNGSTAVQQHFTKKYSDNVVQKVINVPIIPNANYQDIPKRYQDPKWAKLKNRPHMYQRIDGDSRFPTSVCTVVPNCRNGQVLHPSQMRVVTVREYARSQGFPDTYFFHTAKSMDSLFRQIGNAVPIPLGIAIGREIAEAVLKEESQN
ncbi:hypothetical protein FRB99_005733 [Tulasnella sp. 403]|nr:hypothetical protein FRB99_005733 [Tulasnella sp. 403]